MTQRTTDALGTEPIGKLLWKLALPTVAAQMINMLYNIVDRIYIGNMPEIGALALTGVGICLPLILIITAFAALISSGGAPRASIAMGAGDQGKATRILGTCFLIQVVLSIVITAVILIFNRDILLLFGASENTIGYATSYMSIYAIGTIFVQLTLGMNAFVTGQGFAKVSMMTVVIGAGLNIILDPIFIFVLNLGVRGAALATIVSQAVSCIWVLTFLTKPTTPIRLQRKHIRFDPVIAWSCISLGLAPFIMQSSESIIIVCFNASLLKYGGDIAVGAMTILSSVMQFALLPLQGLTQGSQPISSYNFGARNAKRVTQTFKLALKISVIYSATLWAMLMITPESFARIFTSDADLIAFTAPALRIYCAILGIFGVQMACQMSFLSIGSAKCSIIVAVVRKFVLLLPLIFIMPMLMENQTMAVYWAEPIADLIAVTFTAILFSVQFKKAIRSIQDSPEVVKESI